MKTPQQTYPSLAKALGVKEIYLKREDLHPYGSHKGRSIPLMMKEYIKQGISNFVLSSSGNAARAAVTFVEKYYQNNAKVPIQLTVFVGNRINEKKYSDILNIAKKYPAITVTQTERPKQSAFLAEKESDMINLRQSTDDLALVGYQELASELVKIPDLKAVFVPTSSGTTATALAQTFKNLEKNIQVHIVQTTTCHPIAEFFDTDFIPESTSLASAIVDNIAHRKEATVQAIKEAEGNGWIVSNKEIEESLALAKKETSLTISPTGSLGIAGIKKAVAHGYSWDGSVVALITGP